MDEKLVAKKYEYFLKHARVISEPFSGSGVGWEEAWRSGIVISNTQGFRIKVQ